LALRKIEPIRKEASACAIFGAISFNNNGGEAKKIPGRLAVEGICAAEAARGGIFGNGVMFASPNRTERGKNLIVWARKQVFVEEIAAKLSGFNPRISKGKAQGTFTRQRQPRNICRFLAGW